MHDESSMLVLREHLGHDWNAHAVSFPLPRGTTALGPGTPVQVRDLTYGRVLASQIDDAGRIHFIADLWADEERRFAVEPASPAARSPLAVTETTDAFGLIPSPASPAQSAPVPSPSIRDTARSWSRSAHGPIP